MTIMGLASTAFRAGRVDAERARARAARRRSMIIVLFTWLGRRLPTLRKFRQVTLRLGGLALLDYAAWSWHTIAGIVAIGITLLLIEHVTDPDERRRG